MGNLQVLHRCDIMKKIILKDWLYAIVVPEELDIWDRSEKVYRLIEKRYL